MDAVQTRPVDGEPARQPGSMLSATGDSWGRMKFRTESRLLVDADVSRVWTYLCTVQRWREWAPTVLDCQVRGSGPLQPGGVLDQRAKGILGSTRRRSQRVTVVDPPHYLAFAGPLGTSVGRWGMELQPRDGDRTHALMWIEVELKGVMRAVPSGWLRRRIQRVSDLEMVLIKAAVESA